MLGVALIVKDYQNSEKLIFRYPPPAREASKSNEFRDGIVAVEKNSDCGVINTNSTSGNFVQSSTLRPVGDGVSTLSTTRTTPRAVYKVAPAITSKVTTMVRAGRPIGDLSSKSDNKNFWRFSQKTLAKFLLPAKEILLDTELNLVVEDLRFVCRPTKVKRKGVESENVNPLQMHHRTKPEGTQNSFEASDLSHGEKGRSKSKRDKRHRNEGQSKDKYPKHAAGDKTENDSNETKSNATGGTSKDTNAELVQGQITHFSVALILDAENEDVVLESRAKKAIPPGAFSFGESFRGSRSEISRCQDAVGKFAAALLHEELRDSYVTRQASKVLEIQERIHRNATTGHDASNKSVSVDTTYKVMKEALAKSSLMRELQGLYHNLAEFGTFHVRVNGWVPLSISLRDPELHPREAYRPYQTVLLSESFGTRDTSSHHNAGSRDRSDANIAADDIQTNSSGTSNNSNITSTATKSSRKQDAVNAPRSERSVADNSGNNISTEDTGGYAKDMEGRESSETTLGRGDGRSGWFDAFGDVSPQVARVAQYMKENGPFKSFHDIALATNTSMVQVLNIAGHLVFWGQGQVIDTLSGRNVYVIDSETDFVQGGVLWNAFDRKFGSRCEVSQQSESGTVASFDASPLRHRSSMDNNGLESQNLENNQHGSGMNSDTHLELSETHVEERTGVTRFQQGDGSNKPSRRWPEITLTSVLELFSNQSRNTGGSMILQEQIKLAEERLGIHEDLFLDIVVWFLRNQCLVQAHRYIHLVPPTKWTRNQQGSSSPFAPVHTLIRGVAIGSEYNSPGAFNSIPPQVLGKSSSTHSMKPSHEFADGTCSDQSYVEHHRIQHQKMVEEVLRKLRSENPAFPLLCKVLPHLDGTNHFEHVLWRCGVTRLELETVLSVYRDVLITCFRSTSVNTRRE